MFKLRDNVVKIKSSELNFKQRIYKEESIVTVSIMADFFPIVIDNSVISGGVDIKLDLTDLKSIHELVNKKYKGKVGYVTISINNHGTWEYKNIEDFEISFGKIKDNEIKTTFKCEDIDFTLNITMVSLYTTSSSKEELEKNFDLSDFYGEPIVSTINNRKISKYFIK